MSVATKQEFLDRLKASISSLSLQDQADILNDYEEHFRIGLENGKTEAEIADSLGSPEELGASFVEENSQPLPAQEEIFSHSQPSEELDRAAPIPEASCSQTAEPQETVPFQPGQPEASQQAQPYEQSQGTQWAQPYEQSQTGPEALGYSSSQASQQAQPYEQSQGTQWTQPYERSQAYQQSQSSQWTQEISSAEPPQQPPYPPNAGGYSQPPAEQSGSNGSSSVRTGPLVAMILLTVFIMIPVFFGVIVGISVALVCLCFALIVVSMILFTFTPLHFGFAMMGLALIFLALLVLCGLIGFIYGMVKAIIAYSRCFARVIRGKEAQA